MAFNVGHRSFEAVKAQLLAGDGVQALRAAKEARQAARELRDRRAEAEALEAASQVHLAKRDFHEALDCGKSAWETRVRHVSKGNRM